MAIAESCRSGCEECQVGLTRVGWDFRDKAPLYYGCIVRKLQYCFVHYKLYNLNMFGDSTLCTSLLTIWFYCKGICLSIYLSISLSIIVSIYQSIYLSIYLSVCLSVCPSVCLSVCPSVCLSICLFVYLSTCLPVYLPICLTICLPVYLSIYLPVCLFIINPMSYGIGRTRYCIMEQKVALTFAFPAKNWGGCSVPNERGNDQMGQSTENLRGACFAGRERREKFGTSTAGFGKVPIKRDQWKLRVREP